jgi:adenosylhomocysteine nucleosidase
MRGGSPVRILLICPVPVEFTNCRSLLSLRDAGSVTGCRCARGAVAGLEAVALQSGPGKARAAAAAAAAIAAFAPDLVVDTGLCGALDPGLVVGAVIVGRACLEYDISGTGLPRRIIREMRLPSALQLLPRAQAGRLVREAVEIGQGAGVHVREGEQACGEFLIQSPAVRDPLAALTGAVAATWETAGVFVAALRAGIPPASLRAVSDLGDERAVQEFRRNARPVSRGLYALVRSLAESGCFGQLCGRWRDAGISSARAAREVLP